MARGPSANKYGKIALSVADSTEENSIADFSLNSDDGCHINVSSAKAGAVIKFSGNVLVSSKIQHGIQGSESWTTGVQGTAWVVGEGDDLSTTPRFTINPSAGLTTFTGGHIVIDNAKSLYAKDSSGTYIALATVTAGDNILWGYRISGSSTADHIWYSGQTAIATITSAGKLAIGTSTAGATIDAVDTIDVDTATPKYRDGAVIRVSNNTSLEPVVLSFRGYSSGSGRYANIIFQPAVAYTAGELQFCANFGVPDLYLTGAGNLGIGAGATGPTSQVEIDLATEDLEIVDAGSAAATEQDWIEVQVGGNTGYIRVFAAK